MTPDDAGAYGLLRDVVAFTALPAVWVGASPDEIATSIATALDRALPVDAVAVLLSGEAGVVEAHAGAPGLLDDAARAWREARALPAHVSLVSVGPMGTRGAILLTPDPPGERRLLVQLAANLADTAIREIALHRQSAAAREQLVRHEKLAALGQVVSGVAHEVRTPLTYATTNLHLLARRITRLEGLGDGDRRTLEGYTAEVLEAHDRILHIVTMLRGFGRAKPATPGPMDLSSAVAEAVRIQSLAQTGPVTFELRLDARRPILGVPSDVQQIVLNLVQNAAEAMPAGGRVLVATQDAPDGGRRVVEDSGPGIPETVRARMFEPFYSTKPNGTGLGLSIVARLVADHGATIRTGEAHWGGARIEVLFRSALAAKPSSATSATSRLNAAR